MKPVIGEAMDAMVVVSSSLVASILVKVTVTEDSRLHQLFKLARLDVIFSLAVVSHASQETLA